MLMLETDGFQLSLMQFSCEHEFLFTLNAFNCTSQQVILLFFCNHM